MKYDRKRFLDKKMTAARIRQLRKEKGLTQSALAERLGISRSLVTSWECSTALPDIGHIKYMSRLFGVPADYIIGVSNKRYNIKVPDYFEFDLTKLNSSGIHMLHEYYVYLTNTDKYKTNKEV